MGLSTVRVLHRQGLFRASERPEHNQTSSPQRVYYSGLALPNAVKIYWENWHRRRSNLV